MSKRTYKPSKIKRSRKHGFRNRMKKSKNVISSRRKKARKKLSK